MRPFHSPRRSQSGLTLLEVLLAIGVSLIVGAAAMTGLRVDNESKQARAVGQQIQEVGQALNTYIALHYPDIVALEEQSGVGEAGDPGPRFCTPNATTVDSQPTSVCTITTDTLRRSGLLPRNFSGRNAYGASYNIYIRVIGTTPNFIVDGLVVTDTPFTTGGGNRYDLLGQAMQEAGADSGMTRTLSDTMEGLNGTWRDASWPSVTHDGTVYPGVNQLGLLGYRVGYGSSGYAAYLRLDGTTPMTGSLDLGTHDLVNADAIEARAARLSDSARPLLLNADTWSDVDRTEFYTGAGTVAIRNEGGVAIEKLDGTGGALQSGSLVTSDNIISNNGDISAPAGEISAQDLIATRNAEVQGDLLVGGNTGITGSLGVTGNITSSAGVFADSGTFTSGVNAAGYTLDGTGLHLTAGSPPWMYDNVAAAWRTYGSGSNLVAQGVIRGGALQSDGDITGGDGLVLTGSGGTVVHNAVCTAAGTMQLSTGGELVQCVSGRWRTMGVRTITADSANVVSNGTSSYVQGAASCPSGSTLVGGGYFLVTYAPAGGGKDSASPASSFPSGNAWYIRTGQDNGAGTTFRARAVCAY